MLVEFRRLDQLTCGESMVSDGFQRSPVAPTHHDPSWKLTEREEQLIALIFEHRTYKQIAQTLGIGHSTIHTHMDSLFAKLGVHSHYSRD